METTSCDLCGAHASDVFYSGAGWKQVVPEGVALVRCRQCGLMYLNPRPSPDEIWRYYPDDYPSFRPTVESERFGLMRWMRRRKLAQRRKWVEHFSRRPSGSILDVGCATGLFLHEMALAGWEVAGVEPIAAAAEYARTQLGLNIFHGWLGQAPYPDKSFDVITFWDVLEHTYSPLTELMHTAKLLRPGGLVAINIPNWHSLDRRLFGPHWIGFDPPRHLYVFTRLTLTALLKKSGFHRIAWICFIPSYFSFVISLERWLHFQSPRWAKHVGQVLNLAGVRLIFEPWFTVSNWLKLGGVICVVARKVGEG